MIILPFQILCNSGWKDINSLDQHDKPASVDVKNNIFTYQKYNGLYISPCMFKILRCERSRYSQLFLSEPTTVINRCPTSGNRSGSIAETFSTQFFEEVDQRQAMEVLNQYVELDKDKNGCLRNVNYNLADNLMQLSLHCGIPAQIAFTDNVLDLPTLYFGYELPVQTEEGGFPDTSLLGAMITVEGAVIIRTLYKNQYTMFVVTTL